MDMVVKIFENRRHQVVLVAFLLVVAFCLTYYFRNILGTDTLFSHFFYIPIVVSCILWQRKGLYVTILLILILVSSRNIYGYYDNMVSDYIRAVMLLISSVIIVALSEKLSRVEKNLIQSEKKYRTIFENTGTAMIIIKEDKTISLVNSEFEKLSGFSRTEIENRKTWVEFVAKDDVKKMKQYHSQRRIDPESAPNNYEFRFVNRDQEIRDIFIRIDMIPGTRQSVASFIDITQLKQSLEKEKNLQKELANALTKVLSGLIPICSNCKKIRDEKDSWVQLESYIRNKTQADFSHGICPECARELYPEFFNKEELKPVRAKSA